MANYETILVDRQDNIATITFNRPNKRNAMNPKLHYEMVEVLNELRFDKDLRVLILTGAGESFSAGEDLKEFFYEQRERMEFERLLEKALEWRVRILRAFPVPTIAAINGFCFGGAFSIVSGCDIAIAADEATFGLSEVNFGHFPGGPVSKRIFADHARPRCGLLHPYRRYIQRQTGRGNWLCDLFGAAIVVDGGSQQTRQEAR